MASAAFTGNAVPVVDGLTRGRSGVAAFSVSEDGSLVYRAGGGSGVREFVWVTRSGEASPVSPGETLRWTNQGQNSGLRLSPDGRRVAFTNETNGNVDIWTKVLPDGPMSRLTFDDALEQLPAWTPDGRRSRSRRGGGTRILSVPANFIACGSGRPTARRRPSWSTETRTPRVGRVSGARTGGWWSAGTPPHPNTPPQTSSGCDPARTAKRSRWS